MLRKFVLAVLCLTAAVSAVANDAVSSPQTVFAEPQILADLDVSFADLIQSETVKHGPRIPSSNVVLEGSEAGFVLPIVGSTAANGGLFFRSETVIYNRRNTAQDVAVYYFPVGGGAANCNRTAQRMRLNANSWYVWTDFVADYIQTSGLGAVIVIGMTPGGQVDSSARIDGNSRIWTPQPGTSGTTSQNFPAVSLSMPAGGQSSFGLRHDEFYRSNWGIFNYDIVGRTFDVFFNGLRGAGQRDVFLDACSMTLQNVSGGPYGSYELFIAARDGRALYFTFGSSVDNATGDSWSVIGRSF